MKNFVKATAVLIGVAVLINFVLLRSEENGSMAGNATQKADSLDVSQLVEKSVPVRVSGVVEASNEAIVSAKTSGVVAAFPVVEGQFVSVGTLLVSEHTPVAAATLALRQAEAELSTAEVLSSNSLAAFGEEQAAVVEKSAAEIAVLNSLSADMRVAESTRALITSLLSSVTTVADALEFVDANRSLFDSDGAELYREVVADLYGSIPKYFQGGILRTVRSKNDVIETLQTIQKQEDVAVLDVQNLATVLAADIEMLIDVYETGERDVLDEYRVDMDDATYNAYFKRRTALLEALKAQTNAEIVLQKAIDAAKVSNVSESQNVSVTALDYASAAEQKTFSDAIVAATERVSAAAVAVAAAAYGEGNVYAPFSGMVVERYIEVGEYATAGTPLLKLSGVDGYELETTVSGNFASSVKVGDLFMVDGVSAGVVDRFSGVQNGGAITVVVVLNEDVAVHGSTLSGEILISPNEALLGIPRGYVHFDSSGAYLVTAEDVTTYVTIVYDSGDTYFVVPEKTIEGSLLPAHTIRLIQ